MLKSVRRKKLLFSIVVPTYNRSTELHSLLRALIHQDYPIDRYEIIVVDDDSADFPKSLVHSLSDRLQITLMAQNHGGPAAARNKGVSAAAGQFIVFTDDDCIPEVNWLKKLAKRFNIFPDCAIGGRTINGTENNPYSITSQMLTDYLYSFYNRDPDHAGFFTSNNVAIPKNKFDAIGGFDDAFDHPAGEDRDLCRRLLQNRTRLIYAPEVLVYHHHYLKLKTFWRQHFNYGRGAFKVKKKTAESSHEKMKMESFHFYLRLLRYPFIQRISWKNPAIFFLFVISQIANAAGFVHEYLLEKQV